jgi:DNA-binding protein HU-beta
VNKRALVSEVAKRTDMAKASVARVVDAAIESIKSTVARGQRVTLSGFGTFERRKRAPRIGRNPHTGEAVKIPATNTAMFRPGGEFREAVLGRAARKRAAKPRRTRKTTRRR